MTEKELIAFEDDIKELFLAGKIRAPVHLSRGNEKPLLKIFEKIKPEDWCFSTHRSHYHALLKGIEPEWLKAEIIGGRSMHIMNAEHRFFSSSIVGGCLPIAIGVAMSIKRNGEKRKVYCFVGDMAARTGIFQECTQYAINFKLPITFVIEDNGLSTNSPTPETWGDSKRDLLPVGELYVRMEWYDKSPATGDILYYRYSRGFPHINCGQWVTFK